MIVTFSSVRGAPGVSSWALLVAAAWPSSTASNTTSTRTTIDPVEYEAAERVVLEADLDGGVYGARYGFGVDPGVSALAAAVRRQPHHGSVDVSAFARHVAERLWLIPGPETAEQSFAVWASPATAAAVASVAAADERVWVIDAGRVQAGHPTFALVEHAVLSVLVCRPSQADLVQVPARVAALQRSSGAVGVLVVGKCDYGSDELAEFFGTGLIWRVPAGKDLVSLAGAVLSVRRARHSWLWRSALDVAASIAGRVAELAPDDVPAVIAVDDHG